MTIHSHEGPNNIVRMIGTDMNPHILFLYVLAEIDSDVFLPYLEMEELNTLCFVTKFTYHELLNKIQREQGCGIGSAHYVKHEELHWAIRTQNETDFSPNFPSDNDLTFHDDHCKHKPCINCIYKCSGQHCSATCCKICVSSTFVSWEIYLKKSQHFFFPCYAFDNTEYFCSKCANENPEPKLTTPCDVSGCPRRYHTDPNKNCFSFLGKACPSCGKQICHYHREPYRYVDTSCEMCHRRFCHDCWGNKQICPVLQNILSETKLT